MIEKSIILEYRGIDIKDSGKVLRKLKSRRVLKMGIFISCNLEIIFQSETIIHKQINMKPRNELFFKSWSSYQKLIYAKSFNLIFIFSSKISIKINEMIEFKDYYLELIKTIAISLLISQQLFPGL